MHQFFHEVYQSFWKVFGIEDFTRLHLVIWQNVSTQFPNQLFFFIYK